MPTTEFYDACVTRFDSDSGLGGNAATSLPTLGRKLCIGFPEELPMRPCVVMEMVTDETLDGWGSDVEGGTFQFFMYTDARRHEDALNLHKNVIRVFDNAQIAETTPGTTFTTVAFERESGGSGPVLVNGHYQSSLFFRVLIQLTTMNPATRYG